MLVSTKGRYALRVMADLAEHQAAGRIPLKEIAARQNISEKYLESILSVLVRARLLSGVRGKGGGYTLTRSPEHISVGQVLSLTEGSLAPVACLKEGAQGCERAAECPTLSMWMELDALITQFFNNKTIADLVAAPTQFDYVI